MEPQSDPNLHFRDASTALLGIYIHDDRLGPYASADVYSYTQTADKIRTALRITWPGQDVEAEHAVLLTMVVPVPTKLRLSVTRMRELGLPLRKPPDKSTASSIVPSRSRHDIERERNIENWPRVSASPVTAYTKGLAVLCFRVMWVLSKLRHPMVRCSTCYWTRLKRTQTQPHLHVFGDTSCPKAANVRSQRSPVN
jgi:hypothetical protein